MNKLYILSSLTKTWHAYIHITCVLYTEEKNHKGVWDSFVLGIFRSANTLCTSEGTNGVGMASII